MWSVCDLVSYTCSLDVTLYIIARGWNTRPSGHIVVHVMILVSVLWGQASCRLAIYTVIVVILYSGFLSWTEMVVKFYCNDT